MRLSPSGQSRLYVRSGDGQSAVRHHARAPAPARQQLPRNNVLKGLRLPQLSARLAVLGMVRRALFFHSLLCHSRSLQSSVVLVVVSLSSYSHCHYLLFFLLFILTLMSFSHSHSNFHFHLCFLYLILVIFPSCFLCSFSYSH
jgi:hypothetical protein